MEGQGATFFSSHTGQVLDIMISSFTDKSRDSVIPEDCPTLTSLLFHVPIHRHVMNELLDTERAYVEELLCVLEVRLGMGPGVATVSPVDTD